MQADLFCRVIDNFGDIGVSWRLARQLVVEHNWSIRLWVDDLQSFQKLDPRLDTATDRQVIEGVEILHWTDGINLAPAAVVIAMFSCDLPESYLVQMHSKPVLWINLEYLSAEDWVETCHALPSLRSDGLSSYFFFPGFTSRTGGLLREVDLLSRRDAWLKDKEAQLEFLQSLGVTAKANNTRLISLFCYPNAPIQTLLNQLAADSTPSILLLPRGIAPHLETSKLGNLFIKRIPFVPQTEYDKILWTCDLNFVRGEDSIVRAIWAGKPFVWQIYSQTENTHLLKLDAWLARSDLPDSVRQLQCSWNPPSVNSPSDLLSLENPAFGMHLTQNLLPETFQNWQNIVTQLAGILANQQDLATSLDRFIREKTLN